MRSTPLVIAVALAGAAACDSTMDTDGARGACASGGALAGCPDGEATPEAACWRLVECGTLPVDGTEANDLDWGRCVYTLEGLSAERATLVLACVSASTCDELRAPGSPHPYDWPACFAYGDR
jgi:hypothetical protein